MTSVIITMHPASSWKSPNENAFGLGCQMALSHLSNPSKRNAPSPGAWPHALRRRLIPINYNGICPLV